MIKKVIIIGIFSMFATSQMIGQKVHNNDLQHAYKSQNSEQVQSIDNPSSQTFNLNDKSTIEKYKPLLKKRNLTLPEFLSVVKHIDGPLVEAQVIRYFERNPKLTAYLFEPIK